MSSELVMDGSVQALTPEALIRLLRVAGPSGAVTVKGVVTRVTYWPSDEAPKHCYGVLTLGAASIKFRIPPEAGVRLDEPVVLHGTLEIAPTNEGKATHEVKLVGDVLGTWLPRKPEGHDGPLPVREAPPRSLGDFIAQQHDVARLGFLVTETAWNDLLMTSQLNDLRQCPQRRTNFTRADIFIGDLKSLCETEGVYGIVVARGGGDALDTIGGSLPVLKALIGTGLPFYVAMGHANDMLLVDKYADQTFATPSSLGHALAVACHALEERRALDLQHRQLAQRNKQLEQDAVALREKIAGQVAPVPVAKNTLGWRDVLIGVLLLLFAAVVWHATH
ncbi:hypothetical protein [Paraburkholderia aspalathi]|uniref:Exonuclease VII, large subunit n=1 Tax=Paraburkholderia aspalathi TaxID=1324617 RepID=A0A1I7AD13_9BURK|nr:hypothetical protein [Paraburkholderia aspalathi]SFT72866.1 Exonuclease VII, large subunit [Paraburkholderia aspalathi]